MAWVILERFVFRRGEGYRPFPENETAAGSSTCIGAAFRVSLDAVAPPAISRFHLEWPLGPKPDAGPTCHLVGAHRGCILFRLTSLVRTKAPPPFLAYPDDYFLYKPLAAADPSSPWSLTRLPTCIRPKPELSFSDEDDGGKEDEAVVESESESSESESELPPRVMVVTKEMEWAERTQREHDEQEAALGVEVDKEVVCSSLVIENVGLLCHGEDEFVVAELQLDWSGGPKASAELALLRSGATEWELVRLPVHYKKRDSVDVLRFLPRAVVPFGRRLCWVDYRRGVLFCDVLERSPTVSYLPLPGAHASTSTLNYLGKHRGVCATDNGRTLKFIDVVISGASGDTDEPRSPFTVVSYTLRTTDDGRMRWDKDANPMTAQELWTLKAPSPVPHEAPMFPLVSVDKPHVVYFLLSECTGYIDTVTLIAVDMSARAVLSVRPYIRGEQELYGEDADLAEERCHLLEHFIPMDLSRPLNLTRKRKNEG